MDKLASENKFAIMPEWVIELPISHTAFRLYAVLARYADNVTHQAFPALDTLAERLGCGEKTVRRAIDDLIKHGAITKDNRGRYHSNLYTVITANPDGTKMSSRSQMSDEGTNMTVEGTKMTQRVDTDDQVTITTELEPIELEPLNYIVQDFDDFWDAYPRKQGKGKAKEAFMKAVTDGADVEDIISGALRYASDRNLPDPQFIPLPTTWLNQERWEDGPQVLNRKLTNAEKGALMVEQWRIEEEASRQPKEIGMGFEPKLKGIDDE